jgi:hypothetical protein
MYGGMEAQLRHWPWHKMETSDQIHAPANLPPANKLPAPHCIEGWVGPSGGLKIMEKRKFLSLVRNRNPIPRSSNP